MATVYLARDRKHDRLVAVKVLRPELAASLGPARFLQEIKFAAGLAHPHILPLHDSGDVGGFLYYVMPFVEGESLRDRALEIVDERGRVRASLSVLPAKAHPNGEAYTETVLLRLITERGRLSVKIGASEQTAGLSLAGPTNTKNTYVILEAKGDSSSLRLHNEDGRGQVIQP